MELTLFFYYNLSMSIWMYNRFINLLHYAYYKIIRYLSEQIRVFEQKFNLRKKQIFIFIECSRSLDPFYKLSYYMIWVKTYWTYSTPDFVSKPKLSRQITFLLLELTLFCEGTTACQCPYKCTIDSTIRSGYLTKI